MMKPLAALLAALFIVCLPLPSYADKGEKGPGEHAYEHASDNASFKREDNKAGKPEHRRETGSDPGHKDDEGSEGRESKKKGNDDRDNPDADSGVMSGDKKNEKEKKDKK